MNTPNWLKTNVSRETSDRLHSYVALIEKWNPRINLVSKASIQDIWDRHIWDSAQVFDVEPVNGHWADLGSGGGLPAIVLAILAKQHVPDAIVHMVESDQRKCAFLRTVVRELDLNAKVISERIEKLPSINANVISARALTDLDGLLGFAHLHGATGSAAIFQKGENWKKELREAQKNWSFHYEEHNSHTNPRAVILKIEEIARA